MKSHILRMALQWILFSFVLCKKKICININIINWCNSSNDKSRTSLFFKMPEKCPAAGLMLGSVLKISGPLLPTWGLSGSQRGVPLGSVWNEDWWRREWSARLLNRASGVWNEKNKDCVRPDEMTCSFITHLPFKARGATAGLFQLLLL